MVLQTSSILILASICAFNLIGVSSHTEGVSEATKTFCKHLYQCNSKNYDELVETCSGKKNRTSCPLPFVEVGEYCFHAIYKNLSFDDMTSACVNKSGYLAKIDTKEKSTALLQYLISLNASPEDWAFYIGLKDVTGDNADYEWTSDGSKMTFSNWANNQPNGKPQRCVLAIANPYYGGYEGQWDDIQCYRGFGGICQIDRAFY